MTSSSRVAGLDGLRGIAVLLVLFFHVQLGEFRGGFVGVTVFFTLSGFLITARTIGETTRTGSFSIGAFVQRRIRRLAPASVLCIAGTLLATVAFGDPGQVEAIRGDAIGALGNVANWRFLAKGTSYSDVFAGPSPLNHYWSLAIEEQFYILFPLAVAFVVRARRHQRGAVVGGLVGVAAAWSLFIAVTAGGGDRFYYGTDARMFELLVGVTLALLITRPQVNIPGVTVRVGLAGPRRRAALPVLSFLALLGLVVLSVRLENGSDVFARGGAQLAALLTALAIAGLLDRGSPVSLVCSTRPLVWVGKVSYGVYLYHWPIVALTPRSVGPVGGATLAVAQIVASLLLAAVSWRFVERPVMEGRLLPSGRSLSGAWAGSTVALVAAALLAASTAGTGPEMPSMMMTAGSGIQLDQPVPTPPPTTSTTTAAPPTIDTTAPVTAPVTTGPVPTTAAPAAAPVMPAAPAPPVTPPATTAGPPLRVAVAGDSTASVVAAALKRHAAKRPNELVVLDLSMSGCTVTRVTTIRHFHGEDGQSMSQCQLWTLAVPQQITQFQPDITVVFLAMMEQADQRPASDSGWRNVLEPDWAAHQLAEFDLLAGGLGVTGAPGLWADVPYMKFQPRLDWISDDPARTDALNGVVRALDTKRPDVDLLPFAGRLNRPDRSVDTRVRPDGIHLTDTAANALAAELVLPWARQRLGR